jgi:alkylated DNA repair dioxygenase AlkB
LLHEVPWVQDDIIMFGRKLPVPRLSAWFGDADAAYSYSGIEMIIHPWTDLLAEMRNVMQSLAAPFGSVRFNSVLVNLYRDGNDGVAWHADDEPELGREPLIVSVSLGATRSFQLRRRDDRNERRDLELHHGDVVVMHGLTQALWMHQVPKTAKPVGPRLNLTFRSVG